MLTFEKSILSKKDLLTVYDIVADVQLHPEFIPWCSDSKIISRTPFSGCMLDIFQSSINGSEIAKTISDPHTQMLAEARPAVQFEQDRHNEEYTNQLAEKLLIDLYVSFGAIQQRYSSSVILCPPVCGLASVYASGLQDKAIKTLETSWKLKSSHNSCTEIYFKIHLELTSKILSSILSVMFASVCEKMVAAFLLRVEAAEK